MLPEVGATELIVLAAVALIVVGPKDLPVLMRKIGQWVGKMRGLASEFRASFDEMARQSELDELRKEVEALRNTRIPDPLTNLHPTFEEVSAGLDPSGFNIAGGLSGEAAAPAPQAEAAQVGSAQVEPVQADPAAETPPAPKPSASQPSAPKARKPRKSGAKKDAAPADGAAPAKTRARRAPPAAEAKV